MSAIHVRLVSVVVSWFLIGNLAAGDARGWGEYVEPGFPFVGGTVDARSLANGEREDNLIIRGVIVFLGNDTYACYDTDLVRLGAVWSGDFLDYKSMAAHSYYHQGKKNQGGQTWVSRPLGEALSVTGLYPGAALGSLSERDPRPAGPDPRELGRGPIDAALGVWKGVHVLGEQAVVRYEVGGVEVRETLFSLNSGSEKAEGYVRHLVVGPRKTNVRIALTDGGMGPFQQASPTRLVARNSERHVSYELVGATDASLVRQANGIVALNVPEGLQRSELRVVVYRGERFSSDEIGREPFPPVTEPTKPHWPQTVTTRGRLGDGSGYVVDELTLPENNPWQRKVRVADIVFLSQRRAAAVTFDGDVWLLSGLNDALDQLEWRRIASGLHEPQSINQRDGDLFVYTRNGLVRLHDLNGDGEIDFYETFTNRYTQTAETREFPNDSVVTKDGGFLLAKPGQQGAHQGRDNGSILKVSPDGTEVVKVATGFRQPYLGYRASDGLITASDQQGHWVPTTPIHWIREGRHYGFRPGSEVVPPTDSVTEPICWIPHRVVQSATSQVWVESEKLGPLNQRLICLDYYRSNLMLVHLDDGETPGQGAVSALSLGVDLPALKGDINPEDGWLYLTGFQIWGSKATPWSGIRRVRYVGGEVDFPTDVRSYREGILLRFDQPLSPSEATNRANFHVGRWNYLRTKNYGSGYYRLDGESGTDLMGVSGTILSEDRRSLFVAIQDMRPVMQMEVVYRLKAESGRALEGSVYATVNQLQVAELGHLGISAAEIDRVLGMDPAMVEAVAAEMEVSVKTGEQLYQTMGCMACHSRDGSTIGRSGPTLKNVFGARREFVKGSPRMADEAYIKDSILQPTKNVLKAFGSSDIGMPTYQGILSEEQVGALVLFIESLAE